MKEEKPMIILNFYAYFILAMDFDSFSPEGGDLYYEKAANVVTLAQSSGESGWKAFEDNKNRSAVLSAFTDASTKDIRMMIYNYHRKGLDEMVLSPDKGKAVITQSLETLRHIYEVAYFLCCLCTYFSRCGGISVVHTTDYTSSSKSNIFSKVA